MNFRGYLAGNVFLFSFLEGSPRWSFSLWLEVPFLGDELPRFLG